MFLRVVSSWEMAVKYATGRLKLPGAPAKLIPADRKRYGIQSLPLDEESAPLCGPLAKPTFRFDRMLICQSIIHGMAILTPDEAIAQYSVRTLW